MFEYANTMIRYRSTAKATHSRAQLPARLSPRPLIEITLLHSMIAALRSLDHFDGGGLQVDRHRSFG
nr:hypothetical protein CFP56_52183 [Quercus suber]